MAQVQPPFPPGSSLDYLSYRMLLYPADIYIRIYSNTAEAGNSWAQLADKAQLKPGQPCKYVEHQLGNRTLRPIWFILGNYSWAMRVTKLLPCAAYWNAFVSFAHNILVIRKHLYLPDGVYRSCPSHRSRKSLKLDRVALTLTAIFCIIRITSSTQ